MTNWCSQCNGSGFVFRFRGPFFFRCDKCGGDKIEPWEPYRLKCDSCGSVVGGTYCIKDGRNICFECYKVMKEDKQ